MNKINKIRNVYKHLGQWLEEVEQLNETAYTDSWLENIHKEFEDVYKEHLSFFEKENNVDIQDVIKGLVVNHLEFLEEIKDDEFFVNEEDRKEEIILLKKYLEEN